MGLWNKIKNGLKKALVVGAIGIKALLPSCGPVVPETPEPITTPITTQIVDREPPEAKYHLEDSYMIPIGVPLPPPSSRAYATDNVDGDLSKKLKIVETNDNPYETGVYFEKVSVSDSSGNTTTLEGNIERYTETSNLYKILKTKTKIKDRYGDNLTVLELLNKLYSEGKILEMPARGLYPSNMVGSYDVKILNGITSSGFQLGSDTSEVTLYGQNDLAIGCQEYGDVYSLGSMVGDSEETSLFLEADFNKNNTIDWIDCIHGKNNSSEKTRIRFFIPDGDFTTNEEYAIYNEDWSKIKEVTNSSSTPPISFPNNNRQRFSFKNPSKKNPLLENLAA